MSSTPTRITSSTTTSLRRSSGDTAAETSLLSNQDIAEIAEIAENEDGTPLDSVSSV